MVSLSYSFQIVSLSRSFHVLTIFYGAFRDIFMGSNHNFNHFTYLSNCQQKKKYIISASPGFDLADFGT